MLQSGPELYSCTARVHAPALTPPKTVRFCNIAHGGNTGLDRVGIGASSHSRDHAVPSPDVSELRTTLKFDDEVVISRCPQSVSYKKALELDFGAFRPSGERKDGRPLGRHNCRGELKRHVPCHLRSQSLPADVKAMATEPRPSLRALEEKPTVTANVSVVSFRLKTLPATASEEWEARTLQRLSSETARRLRRAGRLQNPAPPSPLAEPSAAFRGPSTSQDRQRVTPSRDVESPKDRESVSSTSPTGNRFVAEFLSGALPVHRPRCTDTTILLDNQSKFEKVLQDKFPLQPQEWCPSGTVPRVVKKYTKGVQRWTSLPQPTEESVQLKWTCRPSDDDCRPHTVLPMQPAVVPPEGGKFFKVVEEWCQQWHVVLNSLDLSEVVCMKNLLSLSNADQVSGILASVMVARTRTMASSQEGSTPFFGHRVLGDLSNLLSSDTERVRVCAALALYCLNTRVEKAEKVLLTALGSQSHPERWAATQCLAMDGVCHDSVIRSLVEVLVEGGDLSRTNKVIDLLASLSWKTPLVAAEVSVLLNSEGWKDRVAGCRAVGHLHGTVSRDLAHRLSFLMWEDTNREVRQAAGRALGEAGEAKTICDEIAKQLSTGSSTRRLTAIKMLRSLKVMTPQLLPAYLSCFKDDHISIKIEAIMIAGTLKLAETQVIHILINLISDPCWMIKAHALIALGDIGWFDDSLVDHLLWAARFEKLKAVRAEACRTLAKLGVKHERIVQTLKELIVVEEDDLVISEARNVLEKLGHNTEVEDDALEVIRAEVCRLGTRQSIRTAIIAADKAATTDYVMVRPKEIPSTRDYLNNDLRLAILPVQCTLPPRCTVHCIVRGLHVTTSIYSQ